MKKSREKKNNYMVIRSVATCAVLLLVVQSACMVYSGEMQRFIQAENRQQIEATAKTGVKSFEQRLSEYMNMVEAMCYCLPDCEQVLNVDNIKTINMMSRIHFTV